MASSSLAARCHASISLILNNFIHALNGFPPDGSPSAYTESEEATHMLYYALVFFVIALIAAFLGFGGMAVAFAGIAKILFFLFIVLFVVSLVMHVGRRV
jgi:uncharacterized membrane protein YtjA (UPF0391 family)